MRSDAYRSMRALEDDYWWHRALRDFIHRHIADRKKVLDIGCGTGGTLASIKAEEAAGVDFSHEALSLSAQRGLKGLVMGSATDLPMRESHFDAVLLIDVLYHRNVGDERAALRECARVLRPGGVLVMQVPAYDWLWGRHDMETHGARRYTRSRIKELVKDSGLEIVKAGYRNLLPLPAAIILRKSASGGGLSRLPPWLNNILYICATAENLLAEAIPLPAGLSVFCVAQKAAKRAA